MAKQKNSMSKKTELTAKQERFVAEYLGNGMNATKAAKSAGYACDSAEVTGSQLLRNPKVAAKLSDKSTKVLTKLDISAERVLNEFGRIAFFDPKNLYEDDGSTVKPLSQIDADTRACTWRSCSRAMGIRSTPTVC